MVRWWCRHRRLRYSLLLNRARSGGLCRLLLFLLLSKGGLHGVGFRCGRSLRRRWPAGGTQIFTLLLLQVFAVSGCRFRGFRYVVWMRLLLLLRNRILVVV